MKNVIDFSELISYWHADSCASVQKGVDESDILNFSTKNSSVLPDDFLRYLQCANGFDQSGNYQDSNGFNFWPIEKICCAANFDEGTWTFDGAENYFIFCDYFDLSWAYALCVKGIRRGEVVIIGTHDGRPHCIADSFARFINMYISNDSNLYPSVTQ